MLEIVIQWFKNFLKRFLPPPTRAFNREVERILGEIRQQEKDSLALIREEIRNQEKNTVALLMEEIGKQERNSVALIREEIRNQEKNTVALLVEEIGKQERNSVALLVEEIGKQERQSVDLLTKKLERNEKNLLTLLMAEKVKQEKNTVALLTEENRKLKEILRSDIKNYLEQQETFIEEIKISDKIITSTISQCTDKLEKELKFTQNNYLTKKQKWCNKFEKSMVEANWGDVSQLPDFSEKFKLLIHNMDNKSIEILTNILIRQKKILSSSEDEIDLFTVEEQEDLKKLLENFNSRIFKLHDNLFIYQKYYLPINHFESSVFYFRHGIEQLKTLDKAKGKDFVDVGGFIGDSVLIFSDYSPKNIYTFEAVPENFEILQQTIALNNIKNVVPENLALSNCEGTILINTKGAMSTTINRAGVEYTDCIE